MSIILLLEVIYYISGGENMFIDCAFEGGGIKGLAYVGALEYFESNGFQIHRAVGTSVGAIFAALAVARFTSKEIKKIIDELSVEQIVDKNGFIASVRGLGFNNIRKFEEKMKEILACKSIYTFADLRFGSDYLLKVIVTSNEKIHNGKCQQPFKSSTTYHEDCLVQSARGEATSFVSDSS